MVSIKNSIYYRSVFYAFLMVIFGVLGYLFLYSGFNTKTRVQVNYEDDSSVNYKVNYIESEYTNTNDSEKYIASMVDTIDIDFDYNNILSEYVSGYYKYNVSAYLIAYEENITDSLWQKEDILINNKVKVLDGKDINSIKINDSVKIDYRKYRSEIEKFIDSYHMDLSGYLHVRINILEFLNFDSLDNEYADNKVISVNIPLTDDIFKISVNNIVDRDSYYEFSSKVSMNIVFIILGAFFVSVALSLVVMVIRQFKIIYNRQSEYNRELKKILSKYDECIVRVNKFYVNKKYNMICVDSFSELMDVYDKTNKLISFKEVKRGSESIFVIIDEDDAWFYKLM